MGGRASGLLLLLAGAAHVPEGDAGRGGAPRRSTPAGDQTARVTRGRSDVAAAAADVPDAHAPKRRGGGAQVGRSGRHGVNELTGRAIRKATPWLKWRAELNLPGDEKFGLGLFPTADDAARAYDAEVRRRGWAHMKPLNFPQPDELAAYPRHAGERCDERGLPLSLAPEQPAAVQVAVAAPGASDQRPRPPRRASKSGFLGVQKVTRKCHKATPWRAEVIAVHNAVHNAGNPYAVGYFATKVGRRRFKVSNSVLKAPVVSALIKL